MFGEAMPALQQPHMLSEFARRSGTLQGSHSGGFCWRIDLRLPPAEKGNSCQSTPGMS